MFLRFAVDISSYLTRISTITSLLLDQRRAKNGAIILDLFCYEGNFLSDTIKYSQEKIVKKSSFCHKK